MYIPDGGTPQQEEPSIEDVVKRHCALYRRSLVGALVAVLVGALCAIWFVTQ